MQRLTCKIELIQQRKPDDKRKRRVVICDYMIYVFILLMVNIMQCYDYDPQFGLVDGLSTVKQLELRLRLKIIKKAP
jgi:hypothetical protein